MTQCNIPQIFMQNVVLSMNRHSELSLAVPSPFGVKNINKSTLSGGHVEGQLIEALRYKPEGCGFDFRRCL
jgi:hypothetical protein